MTTLTAMFLPPSSASRAAVAYRVSNCSVMSAARRPVWLVDGWRAVSPHRWFHSASVRVDQVSCGRPSVWVTSDCRRDSVEV
jgi:hypothetical protein